jgi:alkanesulfonate monooxygenase SsuD/methylene tetrahydromethanopterin reductase-like flavin-dependent oxidoreductase (luciferase family)
VLGELTEQIKLADEPGYDSVSFTEHHFHIEGRDAPLNVEISILALFAGAG